MKTLARFGSALFVFGLVLAPVAVANDDGAKFCPTDAQMERVYKTEKVCRKVCGAHFNRAYGGKGDEWFGCSRFGRGWTCNLQAAGCQWIPVAYPKEVYDFGRKRTEAVEASRKRMEKDVTAALDRDVEASRPPAPPRSSTKAPAKAGRTTTRKPSPAPRR